MKHLMIYVLPRKIKVSFRIGIKIACKVDMYEMITLSKYPTYPRYETPELNEMVSNSNSRP